MTKEAHILDYWQLSVSTGLLLLILNTSLIYMNLCLRICGSLAGLMEACTLALGMWCSCHSVWLGSNPSGSFRLTPTSWHLSIIFFSVSVLPPSAASKSKHCKDRERRAHVSVRSAAGHTQANEVWWGGDLHLSREQRTGAVSGAPADRAAGPADVRIRAQTHQSGNTQSVRSDTCTVTTNIQTQKHTPLVSITGMPFKLLHIRALSIPCRKNNRFNRMKPSKLHRHRSLYEEWPDLWPLTHLCSLPLLLLNRNSSGKKYIDRGRQTLHLISASKWMDITFTISHYRTACRCISALSRTVCLSLGLNTTIFACSG